MKLEERLKDEVYIALRNKIRAIRPIFYGNTGYREYHTIIGIFNKICEAKNMSKSDFERNLSQLNKAIYAYEHR